MNKQYMDFVPAKKAEKQALPKKAAGTAARVVKAAKEPEVDVSKVMLERKRAGVTRSTRGVVNRTGSRATGVGGRPAGVGSRAAGVAKYGVVEDYQPKFVKTEVRKRPLSQQEARDALTDAKQQKIAGAAKALDDALARAEAIGKERKETREAKKEAKRETRALRALGTPFVNTDKIDKRPLSKNVYKKKVVVPKEEPSGPVTIIEKPEKDSKIGLVVAIILTIILGAAAGTVAFLLLPK